MGLISLFRNRQPLSEYRKFREKGRHLNHVLVDHLPQAAILESARKLGLRKGKTLVLDCEDEMSVLFDYCLYSYTRGGKTVIESYLEKTPPLEPSDEMILLRAMLKAHYSVFLVEQIQKGKGATLFDLLRYEWLSLIDIGIGSTAVRGMFFAGRVIPLGEFSITSGAFLPLPPDLVERIVIPALEKFCHGAHAEEAVVLSRIQETAFSGQIIRAALRARALERMAYV